MYPKAGGLSMRIVLHAAGPPAGSPETATSPALASAAAQNDTVGQETLTRPGSQPVSSPYLPHSKPVAVSAWNIRQLAAPPAGSVETATSPFGPTPTHRSGDAHENGPNPGRWAKVQLLRPAAGSFDVATAPDPS